MERPSIGKEDIECIYSSRYLSFYRMDYSNGVHYLEASRHPAEALTALMSDSEAQSALPDAVTCIVILKTPGAEPRLYMNYEFRYPAGRFLLSPPAGLIDPADGSGDAALLAAAKREIREETGIDVTDTDRLTLVSPFLYSTPGMTDESNALVCAVVTAEDLSALSSDGAEGTECFDGYRLIGKREASELLRSGEDPVSGRFSVYTWAALLYFLSGDWER